MWYNVGVKYPPGFIRRKCDVMKKIICLAICIAIFVVLTSCGSALPKGEAKFIEVRDGMLIKESTFEYVNENLVKIVRASDGQVFYVPHNSIVYIEVK